MGKFKDLTGQKFGKLIVIKKVSKDKYGHTMWLCECDCGNKKIVLGKCLRNGATRSCGCYHKKQVSKLNLKHGKSNLRIHKIWSNIKQRCFNKNNLRYQYYGARGITICDEWKEDFMSFYNWAMTNGYKDNLSIDRIDVNGNYEPSNCRWATQSEQNANTRNRKNSTTGQRNIYKIKNYFLVIIKYKNKIIFREKFSSLDEAINERNNFIIKNNLPHLIKGHEDIVESKNVR